MTALERRMANPSEWLDAKSKGAGGPFDVFELYVYEYDGQSAGAACFVESDTTSISVGRFWGGRGFNFKCSTGPGRTTNYPIKFENVVAACFGKAPTLFPDGEPTYAYSEGVAVVTFLLVHTTKFQIVSCRIRRVLVMIPHVSAS